MRAWAGLALLAGAGCSAGFETKPFRSATAGDGDPPSTSTSDPTSGEPDADADSDTDADTDPDPDTDAARDTGTPPTGTSPTGTPAETGGADTARVDTGGGPGAAIVRHDVYCLTNDLVYAAVEATASTGVATLDLWETGAPVGLGWNEEHDLPLAAQGPPELLQRSVIDVSVAGSYVRNVSSLFECTSQFAAFSTSLTAAVRITDPVTGAVDCWIWGDDPNMVLSGKFQLYTPVSDPASLAGCTIVP